MSTRSTALMTASLLLASSSFASAQSFEIDCPGTVASLRNSHPNLHCTCSGQTSAPDCSDGRAPAHSAPSHSRSGGGGMSFDQQVGLMFMQSFLNAVLNPPAAPAAPAYEPPPPPPEPEYVPNPVYEQALKAFDAFKGPESELRKALVAQLSGVPAEALPPKTPDLPAALLLSACLGREAVRASVPGNDDEAELLLRQSAAAMSGRVSGAASAGCELPKVPMPDPVVLEKRRRAAELAADLFAKAGESSARAGLERERARRAEAALSEAVKAGEKAAAEPEGRSMLEAAREQEAAARRELEAARAEEERLRREAEEAGKKGRSVADRLDKAGEDKGKLDALFQEFGDGR